MDVVYITVGTGTAGKYPHWGIEIQFKIIWGKYVISCA